jgi:hypothetical protein
MRLRWHARQYVPNRYLAHKKGISEQPAVTPPPHSLGAHDRGGSQGAEGDQVVERLSERGCFHVVGITAETGVPPRRIFGVRSRFSHPAKRWKVAVFESMGSEEVFERGGVVLGVAPGTRETADVGQLLDAMSLEQLQKDFGWMDRVTNRVNYGRAHAG